MLTGRVATTASNATSCTPKTLSTAAFLCRCGLLPVLAVVLALGRGVQAQTTLSSPAPSIAVGTNDNPFGVAVNVVTGQVYVAHANGNTVSVIDGATNTVAATVNVGSEPIAVAVNQVTGRVYVANNCSNTVSVIDGTSNTVVATVPMGNSPAAVAVNAVTGRVYVANNTSNTVSVIDGATNTVAATVNVGGVPGEIAVNGVTGQIYVANNGDTTVSVIDGATNAVVATVPVGVQPRAVAVNAVTGQVYVANGGSNNVSVIDGASNTVVATIPVGTQPRAVAVNPVTGQVYVPNFISNNVTVIDDANNTVTTVTVGSSPSAVAVNAVTGQVYVGNGDANTVSVIDGASNAVTTVTVGSSPQGVAVNPVTGKVYVANTGGATVSVIDGATNMAAATVNVGTQPQGVAVNGVTGRVYVANAADGTVSVIDGANNTAAATVNVGSFPRAVTVNPVTGQVYVANFGGTTVSVIDGANNTAAATVNVGNSPAAVAVNAVTGRVYVANAADSTVSVIDGANNTVTATVNVGSNPLALAVNAVTGQVYVANATDSTVSVIDGANNTVAATVTVGSGPEGVAVNAVTGQVYVANATDSTVSVIDGANNTVTATVNVGNEPFGVAVNAVTGQVYVANFGGTTVSVIDGASNTVVATVNVGNEPFGVAVNAVTGQVYVANFDINTVSVIDGQGTQGVPIGIATQASATVSSPYNSSAATATAPYSTTFPSPTFTVTATSSYTTSTAYSGVASAVNPPLTALYYRLDDGSASSWQYVTPSSAAGSNPATFPIALSGKKPGFYNLYMFAAYGNEGTPSSSSNGSGNSPEISAVTAYPFYLSPIATTTVVQADANPQGVNQNVTLTASVTPAATGAVATPTGTVNFFDGTTLLNPTPVSIALVGGSNVASFQTSFSTAGAHSITAVFTTGDMNYFGSTSAALPENIETAPTVTGLSPTSGSTAGGTLATITGTSFTGATSVSFGGVAATGLTVNSATSITATSPVGTGVGTVDVVVTTPGGSSATSVADRFTYVLPLTLASVTLPAATAQAAYSQTLSASGGTSPYTYAVSAGALPTGTSLNSSTGVLAGTPTATGTFSFTVRVTDANSVTATASFSLTVNGAVTATQAIPTEVLTQNHAVTPFTPVTGGGGTGPLTYSISPALPAGLNFSAVTGVASGTPSVALTATTFTVTVTNTNSATASNTFVLKVNAAVTATQAIPTEVLTQNHAVTPFTPVTGSGGLGPLAYSISPALPAGLNFSVVTGVVSGTPSVAGAATTYTVTVTDANGAAATASFSLIVDSAVTAITTVPSTTLTFYQATAAFIPVSGSGGDAPLTYSMSATLPAGLTFSTTTGAITGTPSIVNAATSYTVTVTDAKEATATAMFSLAVAKQASQTTVSAAPSTATPAQTVTLTAAVSAAVAGTPTTPSGTVTFYDNGTALMSEPVTGGVAQLTTLLPAGATSVITATYSGDGNFLTSTSSTSASVPVSPLDFAFTNTGTSAYTAAPGAVASYSLALAPLYGSYAEPVSFAVTGLPVGATATFTPRSVAVGSGATPVVMTVQTASATVQTVSATAQTASATAQNKSNSPFGRGIVLAFLLLPFVAKRSVREKMKGRMLPLVLLMAGVTATLTGCGSTGGFTSQSPQTYTLTVTATSGTLKHSQTVTLIVQ